MPGSSPRCGVSRTLERVVLIALVLLATSNRSLGKVAGLTVRPDWVGGVLAVGVVMLALLARRRLPASPALFGFAGFVVVQVLSSVANRAAWPEGLKFSLVYVLALATICAVLILVRDMETVRWTLSVVVTLAVAEAAISVMTVLSSNLVGFPVPPSTRPRSIVRAEGLMSEANLFSSLLLVPFAVALWRWSAAPRVAKRESAAGLALSAGLVFALTRATWLAAIGIAWLSPLRRQPVGRRLRWLAGGVAVAAGLLLGSDLLTRHGALERTGLYDRLVTGVVTGYDEPLDGRREEVRSSLAHWRASPWLGHGAGSGKALEQHYRYTRHLRPEPWLSNAVLFVLHDSGLVGLALFISTLGAAGYQWRRARGRLGDQAAELDHEALGIGLAAVLLAWQVTHGLWQMYGYLYLGLMLAMNRLVNMGGVATGPPSPIDLHGGPEMAPKPPTLGAPRPSRGAPRNTPVVFAGRQPHERAGQ